MAGWQHSTLDYDPASDGDEEEWARAVAAEGWRTWQPTGVWVTVGSRRVRRWALRRRCLRPWSAHDHAQLCVDASPDEARLGSRRGSTRGAESPAVGGRSHGLRAECVMGKSGSWRSR